MKYEPAGRGIAGSKRRFLPAAALAFLLIALTILGAASVFADTTYRVQPGDTLTSIAARYGTTVDAIVAANNLPNRSMIYSGQVLTIPTSGSPSSTGNSGTSNQPSGTYVVQNGDSLSAIAARYGTTVNALMRGNGLNSTTIYAGQVLKIVPTDYAPPALPAQPSPTEQPQQPQQPQQPANPPGTYVVQPGDSFSRIGAKYGISAQALAEANGLTIGSYIYTGQVLVIPGTSGPKATTVPPSPVPPTAAPATGVPTARSTTTPVPVQSPSQAPPGQPVKYTVVSGDTLSSVAARFGTTVDALMQLNGLTDPNFVYVGQVLTIVRGDDQNNGAQPTGTAQPSGPIATPLPPMGKFGPKWVDVNLTKQTMVAYEGETSVYSSLVSSGVANHPTVVGTYRVYAKYVSTRMTGGTRGIDYYDIPNVPYTMYFYSGYALHGAYWHNNFGHPMSHGCVNLPVDVSKWMYNWAPIGTMVVTHY